MSRRAGGLRMLPPFGLPHAHSGNYGGTIEALNAVSAYIRDIPQDHIVMMLGSLLANIDLSAAIAQHEAGGAEITAICSDGPTFGLNHHYLVDGDGFVNGIHLYRGDSGKGLKSLEGYIIHKDVLLRMMDEAAARNHYAFHRHAMLNFLEDGGKMDVYKHDGYVGAIRNIDQYYRASMDMLDSDKRHQIFPAERPVRTKTHEEVSSYLGEKAVIKNSLIADNCIIDGEIENCIVFSGCRIGAGTKLKNSIIMRGVTIGEGAKLSYVISDKYASFSDHTRLNGNAKLPMVVPKGAKI
jgi:glucose-1-phosphate adenylyltransferase